MSENMTAMPVWNASYFVMMFLMWAVMMIGMMVPSVAPAVLIYAAVVRKSEAQGTPVAPTGAFVAGYIAMWFLFSLFATAAQMGLDRLGWLSPMMVTKQHGPGRRTSDRGGDLPVVASQKCLPGALPLTRAFYFRALAYRNRRGIAPGTASRHLLSGLLLGADGIVIRGWGDEIFCGSPGSQCSSYWKNCYPTVLRAAVPRGLR